MSIALNIAHWKQVHRGGGGGGEGVSETRGANHSICWGHVQWRPYNDSASWHQRSPFADEGVQAALSTAPFPVKSAHDRGRIMVLLIGQCKGEGTGAASEAVPVAAKVNTLLNTCGDDISLSSTTNRHDYCFMFSCFQLFGNTQLGELS